MESKTENQQDISNVPKQLQPHVFKKGQSGNIAGRPKGQTLKEYCRDFLNTQTPKERSEFLEGIPKESIWKMAEGNPDIRTDITSGDKPIAILSNVLSNDITKENSETQETNQSGTRRNSGE